MKRPFLNHCLVAVIIFFTTISVVHGATLASRDSDKWAKRSDSFGLDPKSNSSFTVHARQGPDRPKWLRILPLGASIVRGWGPNGAQTDGFRKALRDRLRKDGYEVNMVGSQTYLGGMRDSNHEGHPGHRVDEIINDVDATAGMKPNVVLINAGTNDAQQNYDQMRGTFDRLKQLIKKVQDMHPQTTVVLSTILMTTNTDANNRVYNFNRQIRQYINGQASSGYPDGKIIIAEMNDGEFITQSQMQSDGIHPNEEGYRRMAAVWNKAISEAITNRHWVTEAQDNGVPDNGPGDSNCEKIPGKADGPHQTQKGYGFDDGPYRHTGVRADVSNNNILPFPRYDADKKILFAQIVNSGGNPDPKGAIDDLVYWRRKSGRIPFVEIDYYTNHGDGKFTDPPITVGMPFDCPSEDIRFADVNGDSLDDFLCIGSNGNVRVAVNQKSGSSAIFRDAGLHRDPGPGWENRHVRIGDIDGDGRADYCLIGDDGFTHCWRNGGLGDIAAYWQEIGMTFAPKGKGDIRGTRFLDLNGDGRADWVWVGDKGDTDIYINKRGPGPNEDRYGLVPYWQRAESFHGGMGVAGARDRVHFARLLAKDGSGRRDYAYLTTVGFPDVINEFITIEIWRNDGKGGTQSMSDFNRYCDVNGDGKDDYLHIRPNGDIELWLNIGQPPEWGRPGVIQNIGAIDPKAVHFAKWEGGKRCELLVVDRWSGRVSIQHDEGSGDRPHWGNPTLLGPEFRCDLGWGVGVFDMAHHFADVDGDGRADYLCMEKNGRTFGMLNGRNGPRDLGQVKFSEDKDRANHRFADVNGDGKADFLWIDKFSGEVHVWYNQGVRSSRPADGSMIQWDPKGVLYNGVDRGPNEYFPDYDGDGRADILRVNPITNWAEIWFNSCPLGTGGDDPDSNPNLPKYPPDPPPLTCPAEGKPCRLNPLVCPSDLEDRYDAPVGDNGSQLRTKRKRHVALERRVDKPPKYWPVVGGVLAIMRYVPYPSGAANYVNRWQAFGRPALLRYIVYDWGSCNVATDDPRIEILNVERDQNGIPRAPPTGGDNAVLLHSDHVWDRGQLQRFIDDAIRGVLRSGSRERLPPNPLSADFFAAGTGLWDRFFQALDNHGFVGFNGQGPIGVDRGRGSSRIAECAGSENNMYGMVMLEEDLNLVKGRVMQNYEPYSIEEREDNQSPLRELARAGLRPGGENLLNYALTQIRLVFAVFDYMNSNDVSTRFLRIMADHETEFQNLENAAFQTWRLEHPTAPNQDIVAWWRRWIEDSNSLIGSNAREWVNRAVEAVREEVEAAQARRAADGLPPAHLHTRTLIILAAMVSDSALDPMRLPGVPPPSNDK